MKASFQVRFVAVVLLATGVVAGIALLLGIPHHNILPAIGLIILPIGIGLWRFSAAARKTTLTIVAIGWAVFAYFCLLTILAEEPLRVALVAAIIGACCGLMTASLTSARGCAIFEEQRDQRSGKTFTVQLLGFVVYVLLILWADSCWNVRRLIFVPGGDVGLGFRSASGALAWIEYAPWAPPPNPPDSVWVSVPYSLLVGIIIAVFLLLLLTMRIKPRSN